MKNIIKIGLTSIVIGLGFTGCFTHNVEKVNLNNIQDYRQVMVSNQTFKCQNAFVGGAHKYIVKKDDILKGSKLPKEMEVSSYGELSAGLVDEKAIFLKLKEVQGRDFGFLVYPNGDFVYNRGNEQLGVVSAYGAANEFMFNINCEWIGKTPFYPMTQKEFKMARESK